MKFSKPLRLFKKNEAIRVGHLYPSGEQVLLWKDMFLWCDDVVLNCVSNSIPRKLLLFWVNSHYPQWEKPSLHTMVQVQFHFTSYLHRPWNTPTASPPRDLRQARCRLIEHDLLRGSFPAALTLPCGKSLWVEGSIFWVCFDRHFLSLFWWPSCQPSFGAAAGLSVTFGGTHENWTLKWLPICQDCKFHLILKELVV